MLFERINIQQLLNDNLTYFLIDERKDKNIMIIESSEFSSLLYHDIDKSKNIICICPSINSNEIISNNSNIILKASDNIDLSNIPVINSNFGLVILNPKIKIIANSKYVLEFYKKFNFISEIYFTCDIINNELNYNVYHNIRLYMYINLDLIRKHYTIFQIKKDIELLYLSLKPCLPFNKSINTAYILNNDELFNQSETL